MTETRESLPWYRNRTILTFLAIAVGFLVGGLALFLSGFNPWDGYVALFSGMVSGPSSWMNDLIFATPLVMTGLSVAFGFKTGLFNIGAEGQFIFGAMGAALAGIFLPLPGLLLPLVSLLVGTICGAGWGALAGYFKARFGVHEVISTIMLNWIAMYFNNFVVMLDGIRRPESQSSKYIQDAARIDFFGVWKVSPEGMNWRHAHPFWDDILRSPVNAGILIGLAATILVAFLLKRTTLGFELKAVGFNKEAAQANGISVKKSIVVSLGVAGALAGLAGAVHVLGNTLQISLLSVMEGNGLNGIAVALIGNNTPWGTFFAALFYGAMEQAAPNLQFNLGAPSEVVNIVLGAIIFFLAVPGLFAVLAKLRRKKHA